LVGCIGDRAIAITAGMFRQNKAVDRIEKEERTDAVVQEATERLLSMEAVENAVAFSGFAGATFTNASNAA